MTGERETRIHDQAGKRLRGVACLAACILVLVVFMFCIGPKMERPLHMKPLADFIDEREINANMYFYTEVEEFSEANINMDNTMKFPPRAFKD